MQPANDIRAVLLDFGGVVAEEGFRNGIRAMAEAQGLDPDALTRAAMDAVYDSGFVLGKGTAADFWDLLRRRTGLQGTDEVLAEAVLSRFVLRPWMLDAISTLRKAGLITAILSDQTHWLDELDALTHFKQAFDRIYNSYHLGKGKRDPSLFDDVIADLGIRPAQALFIDDDAGIVERARSRGLQAWQFTDRAGFEALVAQLLAARTRQP